MSTPDPRSFSLIRLFLGIATVGASLAVARLLHPDALIPVVVVGVALGVLVLVVRRGDWPAIGRSFIWSTGGALVGCSCMCFTPSVDPGTPGEAGVVVNAVMGAIVGWAIGGLLRGSRPDEKE